MGTAQLLRLARLVGRDELYARTGLTEGAAEPDAGQRRRLASLVDERTGAIVAALLEEAAASDDVTDADSAVRYATDALAFLGDLLSDGQRTIILRQFTEVALHWRAGPA